MMGRIIGIDYGTKRIGLAVTDPLQIFASPLETVSTHEFYTFMARYLEKETVDSFVIGFPVQMNNQPSESVDQLKPFIKKLKSTYPGKEIHLVDERFTSRLAMQAMIEGGVSKSNRKDKALVDKISASIILQSFLDSRQYKQKNS